LKYLIFNPPSHGSEQMTTKDKSPSRTTASDPKAIPPAESIQKQLNRILTSPEFKATDVQKSFLTFVVETVLAGRSHEIKGYTVATQVFGRGEDFNQATDPIVSIQANKLRRALERYYLVAGQNDPIRIEIPKGTYVPLFREIRHHNEERPFQERRKRPIPPYPPVADDRGSVVRKPDRQPGPGIHGGSGSPPKSPWKSHATRKSAC
jgi:hypothetical protein